MPWTRTALILLLCSVLFATSGRARPAAADSDVGAQPIVVEPQRAPADTTAPAPRTEPAPQRPTTPPEQEARANPVRALLEWQTVFVVGFLWYLTAPGLERDWNSNYSWETFRGKLTLDALEVDRNHFSTNFVGHPVGGTAYYLSARSNGLGIGESLAFTVGGSLLWEFFGEAGEVVSLNDSIVTPMGGVAIGESLTQLSNHLDRRGSPTLAKIANPWKGLNSWLDGPSASRKSADITTEEVRFDAVAALQSTDELAGSGSRFVETSVRFASELYRPPAQASRSGVAWFGKANLSRLDLEASVAQSRLSDLWLNFQVMIAGLGWAERNGALRGALGLGSGFEYGLHAYQRKLAGTRDHLSTVQPVALFGWQKLRQGDWALEGYVNVAPSYGGVDSFALPGYSGDTSELQPVTNSNGYYLALGGRGRALVRATYRALEGYGEVRADELSVTGSPKDPSTVPQTDRRLLLKSGMSYTPRPGGARFGLFAMYRHRAGRLAEAHSYQDEHTFGFQLGFGL